MLIMLWDYVKWLEASSLIVYASWELLVDYPVLSDTWAEEHACVDGYGVAHFPATIIHAWCQEPVALVAFSNDMHLPTSEMHHVCLYLFIISLLPYCSGWCCIYWLGTRQSAKHQEVKVFSSSPKRDSVVSIIRACICMRANLAFSSASVCMVPETFAVQLAMLHRFDPCSHQAMHALSC